MRRRRGELSPDIKLCPALIVLVDEARCELGLGTEAHEALRRPVPRSDDEREMRDELVSEIIHLVVLHEITLDDEAREQLDRLESS